ncbi:MAG: beta-galactosidase trimerization domain-containing protein, partial [Victivallales bacterium]
AVLGCYRALHEKNFAVDFISEEELENGAVAGYKVLYLPHINLLGPKCAGQIREFIHAGGSVWADGRFAWLDEHMFVRNAIPGHGLAEVFGCRESDYIAQPKDITAKTGSGLTVRGRRMQQSFELLGNAECHAAYPDGSIAAVNAAYGKGVCRIWGIELCRTLRHESIAENIQEIADFALSAGVNPEANTPDGVTCRTLEDEHVRISVLFNSSDSVQKVVISENVETLCGVERSGSVLLLPSGKTEVVIQQKR